MKAKKLILVTSESHPAHKAFMKVTEDLSKELGLEKEVKLEDYSFLTDYGEKDEFGMPFLPQLFVETTDGKIELVLSHMPFDEKTGELNPEKGKEEALNKIKNIG